MGTSLAHLPGDAAKSSLIEVCNHVPLRLPKMRNLESLMLSCRSFSRWGREHVTSSFAYKGGQYGRYDYQQPMATPITQDVTPEIIDTLLMLISRMGQRVYLSNF